VAQPVTRGKGETPGALNFDALSWEGFTAIPAVAANVAGTVIQDYLPLVTSGKIVLVTACYSAIGTPQNAHLFNIVVGTLGAYESGASVGATQTGTVTVPVAGDVLTTTIAGLPVPVTVPGAPTVTSTAAAIVAAINSTDIKIPKNPINDAAISPSFPQGISGYDLNEIFAANNAAGVVTVGSLIGGVAFNTISFACTSTGAGGTGYAAGGSTFAGGVNATGITVPSQDTVISTGAYTPAPAGAALFAQDQVLVGAPVGSTINTGAYIYQPTSWDCVFEQGTVLTLRVQTPAGTGSLTNLRIFLGFKPYDLAKERPSGMGGGFVPLRDIG
jgi:hypothetical protein